MSVVCRNHHENTEGAFFCEVCGETLDDTSTSRPAAIICVRCGAPNSPEAQNCAQCGAVLITGIMADHAPDVQAPGAAHLVVLADGATFVLTEKDEIIVGRADPTSQSFPDIDLTAHGGEDGGVSRQHLRLRVAQGRYSVEDLRSSNFTFLNKQRLDPYTPTTLKSGDELRLGRVLLRFLLGNE